MSSRCVAWTGMFQCLNRREQGSNPGCSHPGHRIAKFQCLNRREQGSNDEIGIVHMGKTSRFQCLNRREQGSNAVKLRGGLLLRGFQCLNRREQGSNTEGLNDGNPGVEVSMPQSA